MHRNRNLLSFVFGLLIVPLCGWIPGPQGSVSPGSSVTASSLTLDPGGSGGDGPYVFFNAATSSYASLGYSATELRALLGDNSNWADFRAKRVMANVGSAGSPGWAVGGDTNTGAYGDGSDGYYVATGGTLALTLDSSQNATFAGTVKSDGNQFDAGTGDLVLSRGNSATNRITVGNGAFTIGSNLVTATSLPVNIGGAQAGDPSIAFNGIVGGQVGYFAPQGSGGTLAPTGILGGWASSGTYTVSVGTEFLEGRSRTGTTSGNNAGQNCGINTKLDLNPYLRIRFQIEDITSVRVFLGFANNVGAASLADVADMTQAHIGLQYDTTQADSTFYWVEDNNTTQTRTDTTVTVAADTVYILEIDGTTLTLRDEDNTILAGPTTLSTTTPATGTTLNPGVGVETQTNAERELVIHDVWQVNKGS